MSTVAPIKITGLRELQAGLKALDGESQKQIRVALNSAAELVVGGASRKVPRRSGKAAGSIRAMSSQREARVMGGSKKVPYYGWLDFGGRVGRDHATKRPYVPGGRYLYPAYSAEQNEILTVMAQALEDAARNAGLEVS